MVLIIALAASIVLGIFLLYNFLIAKKNYKSLHEKYKHIINYEAELEKRKKEIANLWEKQKSLVSEFNQKNTTLNNEYAKYKTIYDNLLKEIALSEETLEFHSFGIYKPHYEFSTSDEYKAKLEQIIENQKNLIKAEKAAICTTTWTVDGNKVKGAQQTKQYIKLMLRAFNGECDSNIMKVRWNNVVVMEERIRKAFEVVNKLGTIHAIYITNEYLDLKLQELRLAYEYEEKLHQEKEEQRRIQEQIREEQKVQKEIEKAQKEAEDEEQRYQKALIKARLEMEKAKGKDLEDLNDKVRTLEQQLKEAQELKERALSRAQLTKSGNVYILSNIGSFGDNVYKIGMTRRLDPMDRVKELSDASVPFVFDVHAVIYSENAPELESKLQNHFYQKRVNLINNRKEFYNVTLVELEDFAKKNNMNIELIKIAEAREYRETLALREKDRNKVIVETQAKFPETLMETN